MRLLTLLLPINPKGPARPGIRFLPAVLGASILGVIAAALWGPAVEAREAQRSGSPDLHRWGSITLFHGLPSDHVRAITQDSNGVMWFGTDSGLVKYDGRRIQKIAADGPLANSRILALTTGKPGDIWAGTANGAYLLSDAGIVVVPETTASEITSIVATDINSAILSSSQGEIFNCEHSTDGFKVHRIGPEQLPLLTIESRGRAPLGINCLTIVKGTLIVGTRGRGLLAIDQSAVEAREILSKPRPFFINAIETSPSGNLWIGAETSSADSGLFDATDLMHPEKISAGIGTVTALKSDSRGHLWVGTERGVYLFVEGRKLNQYTFENTGGGLVSNHILSIYVDREEVVWFGTDRGVCRYDPRAAGGESLSDDPESNFVRVLFQSSDGTLWCGTNHGLLANSGGPIWRELKEFKGRIIHSISQDSLGRLLIGTANGLFVGNASRRTLDTPGEFSRVENQSVATDNVRAIETFRGATYLANFGTGIERIDGGRRTIVWPPNGSAESASEVVTLHADNQLLWIGTSKSGVFAFDGRQTTSVKSLDSLVGGAVWSIAGSSDSILWLATDRGLFALRNDKVENVIDGVDARDVVPATSIDSGLTVWCATNGSGVYKVRADEASGQSDPSGSFLVSKIDSEQGVPSQNAFAVLEFRDHQGGSALCVGTSRGIARYQPGFEAPVINLTRVVGKRVYDIDEVQNGLKLEYPQNGLVVDVSAASSRTFPEQFQYSFQVSNADDRVVSRRRSKDPQFVIQGLRPGTYTLSARAFSNDLIPSATLQFGFVVARAPFPWTSTALSVLLGLALLAMWWGYHQNRKLIGTNRQLADTRLQLANETETERRRIARDLHDQTLADLRRLMMLTDRLPTERTNGHLKPAEFRRQIESISTEIRRICEDLSPSTLANVGLSAALEFALADSLTDQPADHRFEYEYFCEAGIGEKLALGPATQIQIYRIIQEALSNIRRHSGATRVRMSVTVNQIGELVIELEDNGRGFDTSKTQKAGRGLNNIRSRASLIEASVAWRSRPQGGMLFRLQVAHADVPT
jgi:signal transduction histidine kinase/ligand-binding sensor domain-containing protein